jgi:hypothetical protein
MTDAVSDALFWCLRRAAPPHLMCAGRCLTRAALKQSQHVVRSRSLFVRIHVRVVRGHCFRYVTRDGARDIAGGMLPISFRSHTEIHTRFLAPEKIRSDGKKALRSQFLTSLADVIVNSEQFLEYNHRSCWQSSGSCEIRSEASISAVNGGVVAHLLLLKYLTMGLQKEVFPLARQSG